LGRSGHEKHEQFSPQEHTDEFRGWKDGNMIQ
jgi:hypothetical protein